MTSHLKPEDRRNVIRIVAVYALFGALWIYLSDSALGILFRDPDVITRIATYKGLLFIATTAALLYVLIGRYVFKIAESNRLVALSEERFRTMMDSVANIAVQGYGPDGTISYWNQANESMYGFTREEALGRNIVDLIIPPEMKEDVKAAIRTGAETGRMPAPAELSLMRKDGTRTLVLSSHAVIQLPGGTPELFCIDIDISGMKALEQELKENEEALRTLLELMPVGVACAGDNGSIEYINQNFVERFGYGLAEIKTLGDWYGRAYPDASYREEMTSRWHADIAECLAHGTPVPPRDVTVTCKDGTVRHAIVNTQVSPHRTVAIFTDITERESLQEEMVKKQKLESIGLLAGGIAHDFNNVLTAILGNISLAAMFIEKGHKSSDPLGEAEKAAKQASALARQLLTFASGGQPVKCAVSLQKVIEDSVSLVVRGSNVTTVVKVPEDLPPIESDAGQMGQVFYNLIINAVQAMPEGGTITITAGELTLADNNPLSLPPGRYVRVTCADQGCGISPENLKNIFDPYFTTKTGGTGLGLASVHSIVNKHRGHISVSSAAGQGTTFELILPASLQRPAAATVQDFGPLESGDSGHSVLVMDDEDMIRDLVAALLEELGYRVTTCSSGEAAIELYRDAFSAGAPFRAVILDLTVPGGMGGKEAARSILDIDPAARLIVSSGYSTDPVMAESREFGFCGAVFKPYSAREIAAVLKETLNTPERA
jgi:PAS domain S-box-containing protein